MPVESGFFIADFDQNIPTLSDLRREGPDNFKLIKRILKIQFPGKDGDGFSQAINASEEELNYLVGVTSGIQAQIDGINDTIGGVGSIPIGGIIMYSGLFSAIAPNFQLCDGTNGSPDLSDKFVLATNTEIDVGNTGGSHNSQVIAHTHTANHQHPNFDSDFAGDHAHDVLVSSGSLGGPDGISRSATTSSESLIAGKATAAGTHKHTTHAPLVNVTTSNAGVAGTDLNRPAYYKLAHIIRLS